VRKPGTVGVDVGLNTLAFLSTGESVCGPKPHKHLLKRLRMLNKSLARKVKGSKNWYKAKAKIAKLHARIVNIRRDALHKLTSMLTTRFGLIGIEDLNISGMVKNKHLARSVMDASWGELFRQLEYKAQATGSLVVKVDRFFPSSKLCMNCGQLHDMPLNKRVFKCDCNGVAIDRDLHAAQNIERFAVGSTV